MAASHTVFFSLLFSLGDVCLPGKKQNHYSCSKIILKKMFKCPWISINGNSLLTHRRSVLIAYYCIPIYFSQHWVYHSLWSQNPGVSYPEILIQCLMKFYQVLLMLQAIHETPLGHPGWLS